MRARKGTPFIPPPPPPSRSLAFLHSLKGKTRESRFVPFYAHRGPTFDLVLEDRLPSCVSHTSTESSAIPSRMRQGRERKRERERGREKEERDRGAEAWLGKRMRTEGTDDIVMQYCEDVPRGSRDKRDSSGAQLRALKRALSQSVLSCQMAFTSS